MRLRDCCQLIGPPSSVGDLAFIEHVVVKQMLKLASCSSTNSELPLEHELNFPFQKRNFDADLQIQGE